MFSWNLLLYLCDDGCNCGYWFIEKNDDDNSHISGRVVHNSLRISINHQPVSQHCCEIWGFCCSTNGTVLKGTHAGDREKLTERDEIGWKKKAHQECCAHAFVAWVVMKAIIQIFGFFCDMCDNAQVTLCTAGVWIVPYCQWDICYGKQCNQRFNKTAVIFYLIRCNAICSQLPPSCCSPAFPIHICKPPGATGGAVSVLLISQTHKIRSDFGRRGR